jgi:hypothetical protein
MVTCHNIIFLHGVNFVSEMVFQVFDYRPLTDIFLYPTGHFAHFVRENITSGLR